MKWRLAKKIESELRSSGKYTERQYEQAVRRIDRCRSSREYEDFVEWMKVLKRGNHEQTPNVMARRHRPSETSADGMAEVEDRSDVGDIDAT